MLRTAAPIAAGAALISVASLAHAQDAGAPAPSGGSTISEVVVTAQFREQNLQQTPLAITAVNAQMLENRSQTNVYQVAAEAPNVSLRPAGGGFGSAMVAFIRGVGQTDFNFSQEPGVAIYVDDVYYSTLTGSLLDLMDLDRVEVLRGPQGTLAGRNAIGGAIKLYSKKPDGEGGGYIEGTYGSLNRIDFRGGADFAIVPDKLFVRISGATRHHDGYVTRLDYKCTHPTSPIRSFMTGTGCELGKEGGQSFDAIKGAVRWLPTDNIEVNVSAGRHQRPVAGAGGDAAVGPAERPVAGRRALRQHLRALRPQLRGSEPPERPVHQLRHLHRPGPPNGGDHLDAGWKPVAIDPIDYYRTWGVAGTIDWKLGDHMSLKSITSYRKFYNSFAQDTAGSPVGVELLMQTLHHSQWTQEFRLNGTVFNSVNYTLGAFYASQDGDEEARVDLPYTGTNSVPGVYNFDFDFKHGPDTSPSTSKAVYGNIDWAVTDRIDLIGGIRYSKDEKSYTYHRHNPDGTDVCATPNFAPGGCTNWLVYGLNGESSTFKGSRWDYRGDIDFKVTDDVLVYAEISTGYKGGGANARPFYGGPPGPTCAVPTCQVTTFKPRDPDRLRGRLQERAVRPPRPPERRRVHQQVQRHHPVAGHLPAEHAGGRGRSLRHAAERGQRRREGRRTRGRGASVGRAGARRLGQLPRLQVYGHQLRGHRRVDRRGAAVYAEVEVEPRRAVRLRHASRVDHAAAGPRLPVRHLHHRDQHAERSGSVQASGAGRRVRLTDQPPRPDLGLYCGERPDHLAEQGRRLAGRCRSHQLHQQAVLPDLLRPGHGGRLCERPAGHGPRMGGHGEEDLLNTVPLGANPRADPAWVRPFFCPPAPRRRRGGGPQR
ncbi:MAG: TonB-dependent receptor [Caulobacteraceae bacterium]